jgi:hypothetical protein
MGALFVVALLLTLVASSWQVMVAWACFAAPIVDLVLHARQSR